MWKAIVAAASVAALAAVGIVATAGAQVEPAQHVVSVTKVVENAPDEADFEVLVDCGEFEETLAFEEEGGTQAVVVGTDEDGDQECTIEETETGGATDVEVSPEVCVFVVPDPVTGEDDICEVTVENSFDEPVTTTTVASAPPVIVEQPVIVPAPVIVAGPSFTG